MPADHYAVLGVAPEADAAEIRTAYLRLMRLHHPDHRSGEAGAEERAQRLNAAYEVLGDPARRAAYDRRILPRPRAADRAAAPVHPRPAAYSEERAAYRRSFSAAAIQVTAVLLLVGTLLLVALSAP